MRLNKRPGYGGAAAADPQQEVSVGEVSVETEVETEEVETEEDGGGEE